LQKAHESNEPVISLGKVRLSIYSKSSLFETPSIPRWSNNGGIDGIPTDKANFDFWSLNSNDIAQVSSAEGYIRICTYGSLGINGAIMIVTKK